MRYAIYFTPPEGDALAVLAANWLGRDHFRNQIIQQRGVAAFPDTELAELTAEPRRYGFHATLKAPFELAQEMSEAALHADFDAFAASFAPLEIPSITLGQLGAFFALVPADWNTELQQFAEVCVRHFEPFRAPIDEKDVARRNPDSLSASQRHHLMTWGYPYVFEDFRFHMTLTGQVPAERQTAMRAVLAETFSEVIDRPLDISHLALFKEPARGAPFVLDRVQPLSAIRLGKTA
jgi:putative phosphonate metabolism protein